MNSELKFERDIFFGGFSSEYNFIIDKPDLDIFRVTLASKLIQSLLPAECLKERSILDIKGRDALNLIDDKVVPNMLPTGDEFLFLKGVWIEKPDERKKTKQHEDEEPLPNDFTFRINSIFEEYIGRNQIKFKCIISSEGEIPQIILGAPAADDKLIKCSALRLGIDLFFPHFFNILGFGPVANQTLLIESYQQTFKIRITDENKRKKKQIPLERHDLFKKLDLIIKDVFAFSILEDYIHKIK